MKEYEVREWSMTDARTGEELRGWAVYWPGEKMPRYTTPVRARAVRWASDYNKRVRARYQ